MSARNPTGMVVGEKYHRLTILSGETRGGRPRAFCRCECGTEKWVILRNLRTGHTRSCGCLMREVAVRTGATSKKHGHARTYHQTPTYRTWSHIIARCEKPSATEYRNYGGRGIRICDRWRKSFPAFLEDMGQKPSRRHSIDRVDPNGHYEPGNCRWATAKEQQRNRRYNHVLTLGERSQTIAAWAEEIGTGWTTIRARLERGWSVAKALQTPIGKYSRKK